MKEIIVNLKSQNGTIHIMALESKINQYDTTYFGLIKVKNYKTYCYFTKSQIDYLDKYFVFKKCQEPLKTSSFLRNKKEAIEANFYFNTFVPMLLLRLENDNKYGDKDKFISEYIINPYLKSHCFSWIISDRKEVIYNENIHHNQKKVSESFFSYSLGNNEREYLSKFKNYQDFKEHYNIKKEYSKDFDIFFDKMKLIDSTKDPKKCYEVNPRFFRAIHFVWKVFNSDLKSFKEYESLIKHILDNYKCFIDNTTFNENGQDLFLECFNKLAPNKKVNKLKKWKFYFIKLEGMKKDLKLIEKVYDVDYGKFDDPIYCFQFYAKKYSAENIIDYPLKNPNKNGSLLFSKDTSILKLSNGYSAQTIKTKNELVKIGSRLHNCAGGISESKYYDERLSFAIYKDGTPEYLGTIYQGRMCQLKGFKNSKPSKELFSELILELVKNNFIEEYRVEKSLKNGTLYNHCCLQIYNDSKDLLEY